MGLMEALDTLEGFKRFILVLPMELAFLVVVAIMAYQGQITEALAAVTGLLGGMIGYYFGSHQAQPQMIESTILPGPYQSTGGQVPPE